VFNLDTPQPLVYTPTTPPAPITAEPTQEPKPVVITPQAPTDEKLIAALIEVESQGNDNAIGDKSLAHHAYGCLQIRQPVCDDVNRVYGLYGPKIKAQDMLGNRALSIDTFRKYVEIYRCITDEDKARVWNGGPSAKRKGTAMYAATTLYWHKVQAHL
jgi:hypothetical protein